MTVTNTKFPLSLSRAIDRKDDMYSSVRQLLWIVMKWRKLTTPPGFTIAATGSLDTSEDSSTIEYQGTVYDIRSAKITAPSHKTWILPDTNTDLNTLDLFITFQSSDSTSATKYIFVVIPLLSDTDARDPPYLAGLADKKIPGPYSFEDVLPLAGNRDYAYYSTNFTITGSALTTSGLTLVFYNGIHVPTATLNKLKTIAKFTEPNTFPAFTLPTDLTPGGDGTIESATAFPSIAGVSTYTTPLANRTDLTTAYKCVPLDPDTDISGGKIQFDPNSSEIVPLNKIMEDRYKFLEFEKTGIEGKIKGSFEMIIAIFLGIVLAITLVGLVIYFVCTSMYPDSPNFLGTYAPYFYTGVIALTVGYLFGVLYNPP